MAQPGPVKNPPRKGLVVIILLANLLAPAAMSGEEMPAPVEVIEFGDFAVRIPGNVKSVRGILLALGGPDTRAFATGGLFGAPAPELEASLHALGEQLHVLAADHGLAILGTTRQNPEELPNLPQTDAIIFAAIGEAARVSGRPELTSVPIFVYAISGGTPQAAGFTARNPERVGALLLKVPAPPERLISAEALAVPTYLILAEHELFGDNRAVLAMFESNRRAGGLWAMAVEPGVPHHALTSSQRAITVNWLRAIVGQRLGPSARDPLRKVTEPSGWLGHPDFGVSDWTDYSEDRNAASWFPSRATAEEWWAFIGPRDVP